MTRPTLRDVAKLAGVSTASASMALRGLSGVSATTRETVLAAARQLDYVVNISARNLRRQRTDTIGVYLPPGSQLLWYYAEFALGATDAASEQGVATLILPQNGDVAEFVPFVDGIITVDVANDDANAITVLESGKPVVTGEGVPEGMPPSLAQVSVDHRTQMRTLLEHLAGNGADSIGVILPPGSTVWGVQLREALGDIASAGIDVRCAPVPFCPTGEQLVRAVAELDGVAAVVAAPDATASSVADHLRDAQLTIGTDVLLAAYAETFAEQLASPPITALDLRPRELGARCVQLLLAVLAGKNPPLAQSLETSWNFRESTGGPVRGHSARPLRASRPAVPQGATP